MLSEWCFVTYQDVQILEEFQGCASHSQAATIRSQGLVKTQLTYIKGLPQS